MPFFARCLRSRSALTLWWCQQASCVLRASEMMLGTRRWGTREEIDFDGHKKIKGRKRHLLVDTMGLVIVVVVTDAGTDDRLGLVELLHAYFANGVKRLRKLWVDGAYPAAWLDEWVRGLKQTLSLV